MMSLKTEDIFMDKLGENTFYLNSSILKLEEVYQLCDINYILMNVYYNDRNVGNIIYNFEYKDINYLSKNCNNKEYELINVLLEHYNYFDKRIYNIPKLEDINVKTILEYKYTDIFNNFNYNIKIRRLNNIYKEDEYISAEFIINNSLTAIITSDNEYNNRLTFVKSFKNNENKEFILNLIKLVLYIYNNNNLIHCSPRSKIITFNLFEDQHYHRI
jgi:hypothetical protein